MSEREYDCGSKQSIFNKTLTEKVLRYKKHLVQKVNSPLLTVEFTKKLEIARALGFS